MLCRLLLVGHEDIYEEPSAQAAILVPDKKLGCLDFPALLPTSQNNLAYHAEPVLVPMAAHFQKNYFE